MIKRECGSCSLCCKVMGVPEVKADHAWCRHARPGKGCAIYQARPGVCRSFNCGWLVGEDFPDYWYPKYSKIVINSLTENGTAYIAFVVDPAYPTRWREEPYFSDIKKTAQYGLDGTMGSKFTTLVVLKDEKIPIIASERLLRAAG
jgi:hypothetical protein